MAVYSPHYSHTVIESKPPTRFALRAAFGSCYIDLYGDNT
jgi:hypothetical protein